MVEGVKLLKKAEDAVSLTKLSVSDKVVYSPTATSPHPLLKLSSGQMISYDSPVSIPHRPRPVLLSQTRSASPPLSQTLLHLSLSDSGKWRIRRQLCTSSAKKKKKNAEEGTSSTRRLKLPSSWTSPQSNTTAPNTTIASGSAYVSVSS